jgi:outer membrane protein TolC
MIHGMGGSSIPAFALAASSILAAGCAATQLDLSERQTGTVLTDLSARVAAEREASKKASDEKPAPKKAPPPTVPPLLALKDALKIAGRQNRDLIGDRESLTLSALALISARNDVGPRLAGAVSTILTGDDRGEKVRRNAGTLSVGQLLPTGATASVVGDVSQTHGLGSTALDASAGGGVTATISQPLLRGFGYESSHEALTSAERQALYDVRGFELSRQGLALAVQSAFYGLVTQKQVIRNRESSLESFEFLKRRSDRLFELGRVSEVDKFRAAREYLVAQNELVDTRQEYESRLDRFKVLLGVEATTKIDVAEEIPSPRPLDLDLRRAIDVALLNRLDLATTRDEVDDAERRLRISERELLPDLDVEAVGRRAAPDGSRHVDTPLSHDTWSLGLSLELPLDRVKERAALRSSRIALDRARRDLSLKEDSVILEVGDALRNLRSSESSLKIQEQIAESEERNVRVARMRFESGEISNRDLTEALTALADARDRLVREKANLETARLQLLRDLGVLYLDDEGTWRE